MANRTVGKAKKPAKKLTSGAKAPGRDRVGTELLELRGENARLKAELQTAMARLKDYEAQRKALADRIEWAIDSLHTVIEADE